jgi:putative Mn2+ efflux pump MntP
LHICYISEGNASAHVCYNDVCVRAQQLYSYHLNLLGLVSIISAFAFDGVMCNSVYSSAHDAVRCSTQSMLALATRVECLAVAAAASVTDDRTAIAMCAYE